MRKDMRQDSGWLVFGALLAGVAFMVTGCGRGHAIYGEFGYKQIDEYQSSQRTYRVPIPPKCYVWSFEGCAEAFRAQQAPANNGGMVEGS